MSDEFGYHSKREGVSQDQEHLFDPEPFKTGWTKEEGDEKNRQIWARINTSNFHDRRG